MIPLPELNLEHQVQVLNVTQIYEQTEHWFRLQISIFFSSTFHLLSLHLRISQVPRFFRWHLLLVGGASGSPLSTQTSPPVLTGSDDGRKTESGHSVSVWGPRQTTKIPDSHTLEEFHKERRLKGLLGRRSGFTLRVSTRRPAEFLPNSSIKRSL